MFDEVIKYDQKMNGLNDLVANREQAISRGDYGHSKAKKKALLERFMKEQKSAAQEELSKLDNILSSICT